MPNECLALCQVIALSIPARFTQAFRVLLAPFAEEEPKPLPSSTDFPISINRDSRLQGLLDNLLLDLNINLRQLTSVKDKIFILDSYLENANKYRKNQLTDFEKYQAGKSKYITNQNLGLMNRLINELGNKKAQIIPSITNANPLTLIDSAFITLFEKAEKKALGDAGKWVSSIRCAAFCELLWDKNYFNQRKNRIKVCNDFAKGRYGLDIQVSLQASKKDERDKHKNHSIRESPPLKKLF